MNTYEAPISPPFTGGNKEGQHPASPPAQNLLYSPRQAAGLDCIGHPWPARNLLDSPWRASLPARNLILLFLLFLIGCTEKNVTNNYGPEDWQPPVLTWLTPPESDVRGTVGIDVSVVDSSVITSVRLYVDGIEDQTATVEPFRFEIVTDSLADGVHLLEARAWDQYGNMGVSPILRMNVANQMILGPHVIWVPDSFATIQAAINASTDYDTIRVRDGTYYETLNLFGKGIWIESENGPLSCLVSGGGASNVFFVPPALVGSTIRGFTLAAAYIQIFMDDGSRLDAFNNIFLASTWQPSFPNDSTYSFVVTGSVGGSIVNNLFSGSRTCLQLFSFLGVVENNIIQLAYNVGLWNSDLSQNPVLHGYNIYWQNGQDYQGFSQGVGEFNADPLLDLPSGTLQPGSPCIDAGDPDLLDIDLSRSDIGPFGGPKGYR